jgi:hypothetical protein
MVSPLDWSYAQVYHTQTKSQAMASHFVPHTGGGGIDYKFPRPSLQELSHVDPFATFLLAGGGVGRLNNVTCHCVTKNVFQKALPLAVAIRKNRFVYTIF